MSAGLSVKKVERVFESLLWNSRYIVLLAVVTSLLASLSMFYLATVDAYFMISHLGDYLSPSLSSEVRAELRGATIAHVVEIVDGYLLAAVLLIFSLGLYELFISKIDQAEESETSSNVLLITSLDDLKGRLAKVVLMILIVKFFEHVLATSYQSPLDLLYLACGIMLIGLALFLTNERKAAEH